jgi:hypothetical protein
VAFHFSRFRTSKCGAMSRLSLRRSPGRMATYHCDPWASMGLCTLGNPRRRRPPLHGRAERPCLGHVVDVGLGAHHAVHEPGVPVHADVGLRAEVVSRPQDLPLQPLAEPDVTLSRHTASVQPFGPARRVGVNTHSRNRRWTNCLLTGLTHGCSNACMLCRMLNTWMYLLKY